jgi:5-methylcytosine-specific restriction endonuclease McrA
VIGQSSWEANHIFPLALGGDQKLENYLPAHRNCNGAKWHLRPKELQLVLKLGGWLRSEIERGSALGKEAAKLFCISTHRASGRRKR